LPKVWIDLKVEEIGDETEETLDDTEETPEEAEKAQL